MHYSILATNGKFRPFSYHASKNLAEYGNGSVPEYELENIKVPIFLLSGEKDGFTHKELMDKLKSRLKGASVNWRTVGNTNFLHLDFFVAKNLRKLVFEPVLNYLRNPYSIVESPRKPKN
ncbi:lipase 3-like [Nilaparvata lugens]|uniref:lipase 3-like n=1 Tax=Nilaparvata lugens TaxID=108931 RepID=UPI00193E6705|nr:lipase 3-like [Nilaparvata lugens]